MSLVIEEDGKRRTVVSSVPNSLYFMDQIQDDIDKYNEANPGDKLTYQILPPVEAPWWVQMLPTLLLIGAMVVFLSLIHI